MQKNENSFSAETLSVICGNTANPYEDALNIPIFQTSTFGFGGEFSYTRCDNPTRKSLETALAAIEYGQYAFAFSSGLAAINSLFSLFKSGERIVLSDDIYGGTYRLADKIFSKYGIEFVFADLTDAREYKKIKGASLVLAESPTNPTMKVAPIREIASACRKYGSLFAVDNTFLTPCFQNPLRLGADIVIHSATKYISGHHDCTAGAMILNDFSLAERVKLISNTLGNALSPFESFLVMRGIKTLPLRMKRHAENAMFAARFLQELPEIKEVIYPGLPSHAGHGICAEQASGFGGVVSFRVRNESAANRIKKGGRLIKYAESLGGTRTLITHPLTQTHYSLPDERKKSLGITEDLFRLSVGLEKDEDICFDLRNMLKE